jgi:hypothetical protein
MTKDCASMTKTGMYDRQHGLSLVWVTIVSALLALAAMAALFSLRYERNLFGQAWDKAPGSTAQHAMEAARKATGAQPAKAVLRKCVIGGQTVVSNTDCAADNKTARTIDIYDTRGIEAPKQPVAEPAQSGSGPTLDKIIEKQTR